MSGIKKVTLKNLPKATAQQVFDQMVVHMLTKADLKTVVYAS